MAEATAVLNLDASGLTSESEKAVRAYLKLVDADRKMKSQVEKPAHGNLDRLAKDGERARQMLAGVERDSVKASSVLNRMGASLTSFAESVRMSTVLAAPAAVASVVATLRSASDKSSEWRKSASEISERSGRRGSTPEALQANIDAADAKAEEGKKLLNDDFFMSPAIRALSELQRGLDVGFAGADVMMEKELTRLKDAKLRDAGLLVEESQKDLDILRQKLQGTAEEVRLIELKRRLEREIREIQDRESLSGTDRDRLINAREEGAVLEEREILRESNSRTKSQRHAMGLVRLSETRKLNPVTLAEAGVEFARSSEKFAGNKDEQAVAKVELAQAKELLRLAKEEFEISEKTANLMTAAFRERIFGNERVAASLERQAQAAAAIARAERAGNPAEAARIRRQADLVEQAVRFDDYIDPETGRPIPRSERNRRMKEEQRRNRRKQKSAEQYNRNGGLDNVHKDTMGNIISGIDPTTGERRAPNAAEREAISKQMRDDWRKNNDHSLSRRGRNAESEMSDAQSREADRRESERASQIESDKAMLQEISEVRQKMNDVYGILSSWN